MTRRKNGRAAGIFLLCGLLAAEARADYVLSTATPYVQAGEDIEVSLLVTNPGSEPLLVQLPAEVHMRMDTGPSAAIVEFFPGERGPLTVAPGGFRRVVLRGTVPPASTGNATLSMTGFAGNPLLITVEPRAGVAAVPPASGSVMATNELVDKPPPLGVSLYEPVYFIVGGDGGLNAKFQISLRYRMFDGNGALARRLPWLDDLYFSYSQTSLWELDDLSKPFRDSSYRPRFFYSNLDLGRVADGRIRLGVEGGFGHESNGKDGLDSRSINILYARPTLTLGDPEGQRLYLAPLFYGYLDNDENQDIADYRGHTDLLVGFGRKSGWDAWAILRKGSASDYGSVEFNVSYPLSRLSGGDLTGWLLLQYFSGHGESLLDYNRKLDSQFRFGLAVAL